MAFFDNNYQMAGFITSIFAGIFSYFVMMLIIKRYYEKKSEILRTLMVVFFFLASAIIIDPLLFTIYRILEYQGSVWDLATAIQSILSFGLAGIANAFLVVFLVKVFTNGKYPWYAYVLIILELITLPAGEYFAITQQDTIPVLFLFVITSLVIYILQIIASIQLRRRIKEKEDIIAYKGILYIAFSGIFLIITFICFILQQIGTELPILVDLGLMEGTGTIFMPLGWIFAGITTYVLYVGYIVPKWLKKRWMKD